MGTTLAGTAWADRREEAVAGLEAAIRAVEAMDDRLSTWRSDTELAALNGAPAGRPFPVGDTLFGLLADARRWWRATEGAFDPAVGRLVELWDLRGEGRVPADDARRRAVAGSGMECYELDADGRTVIRTCADAWIDAGAFGKGAAFRTAAAAFRDASDGSALLDFGGQLMALGSPPDAAAWRVGVAHPSRRDSSAATLALRDRSAATTSASERFVTVDGERRGHVLDPRSGEPVPAWGSVTVVADDPLAADALSTALFVRGPEEAMRRARRLEDVGVLVLVDGDDGLRADWNQAMERHLVEPPDGSGASGPDPSAGGERRDGAGAPMHDLERERQEFRNQGGEL